MRGQGKNSPRPRGGGLEVAAKIFVDIEGRRAYRLARPEGFANGRAPLPRVGLTL